MWITPEKRGIPGLADNAPTAVLAATFSAEICCLMKKDPAIGAPGQNSLARAGATVVYFRIATFSGPGSSLGKLLMSAARP
jgi:uncharacterized RDD family membrane protein YckC